MGDHFFEYAGVPPARFGLWRDILRDVGRPDQTADQARSAIDQLWPHLEAVNRHLDVGHPHVAAYLASIRRSIEASREPSGKRRLGDASLDLSHVVGPLECLLLGLVGPEGQSPFAPCRVEVADPAGFERRMAARNLVPGPGATQTIGWRTPRAYLLPAQVKELAGALEPGELRSDLARFAERGEAYVGWMAWYGSE